MSASVNQPAIPSISPRMRRVLVAGWISLGVHAALVALVQVAPPATVSLSGPVIEARLVPAQAEPRAVKVPPLMTKVDVAEDIAREVPLLVPSVTAEAVPVAEPVAAAPAQAAPAAARGVRREILLAQDEVGRLAVPGRGRFPDEDAVVPGVGDVQAAAVAEGLHRVVELASGGPG